MFKRLLLSFLTLTLLAPQALATFPTDQIDRIVSSEHALPADYVPADLVRAVDYGVTVMKPADLEEMQLRLAQDVGSTDPSANLPSRLAALFTVCLAETGEQPRLGSGYRSFEKQRIVFWNHRHDGQAAEPGTSEHQAGLAADIAVGDTFLTVRSKTYACFQRHAWEYGFVLTYPEGNDYLPGRSIFEPWHWRYVGLEAARLMHDFGKQDYPAEFLARLPYFRWLAWNGLTEDWAGLTRAVERLAVVERKDARAGLIFAGRVEKLATRVAVDKPLVGPRLAVEYLRWRASSGIATNIDGLRTAYAELDALKSSDDRRDRVAVRRVEKYAELLRADVLGE